MWVWSCELRVICVLRVYHLCSFRCRGSYRRSFLLLRDDFIWFCMLSHIVWRRTRSCQIRRRSSNVSGTTKQGSRRLLFVQDTEVAFSPEGRQLGAYLIPASVSHSCSEKTSLRSTPSSWSVALSPFSFSGLGQRDLLFVPTMPESS